MIAPRRFLFSLLACALFVAGCGGDDAVPETTTTLVHEVSTIADSTTTTEDIALGELAPLTGAPVEEDNDLDHPAIAVKIGNNDNTKSRPQAGIADADIVFEVLIEAEVTRFLALFHSILPAEIAPLRSGRSSDPDLVGAFNTPLFAFWGTNSVVGRELATAENAGLFTRNDVDRVSKSIYMRDPDRPSAPYNGMLLPEALLEETATEDNGVPESVFTYRDVRDEPAAGQTIGGVSWDTRSRQSEFIWDEDADSWLRIQEGTMHVDDLDNQVAVKNVVVLFVRYSTSAADPSSAQANTTGEGEVWIFSDGKLRKGTWTRPDNRSGWEFTDEDGDDLELAPGQTWVYVAGRGEVAPIPLREAPAILEAAQEASE